MRRENIFFKDWWVNHDQNKNKKRGTEDLKIKIEKKEGKKKGGPKNTGIKGTSWQTR